MGALRRTGSVVSRGMQRDDTAPGGIAYGMWNAVTRDRSVPEGFESSFEWLARESFDQGVRTFLVPERLGGGKALEGLRGLDREACSCICLAGEDSGNAGGQGYVGGKARFTDRPESDYRPWLERTVSAALERAGTSWFDGLLLENPDWTGFRSEAVWEAMGALRDQGLVRSIGIAPGPNNGYVLDLLQWLDRFGERADLAMIVFSPIEPWPGELVLERAAEQGIRILAREGAPVPGPAMAREMREREAQWSRVMGEWEDRVLVGGAWATRQKAVEAYAPRTSGRACGNPLVGFEPDAVAEEFLGGVRDRGDNRGQAQLKGGTQQFQGLPQSEQWPLDEELAATARRHGIVPDRDYFCENDPRDLRDFGMPGPEGPQATDRRLFLQLQVFTGVADRDEVVNQFEAAKRAAVIYADLNDPRGVGVLLWDEDPLELSRKTGEAYNGTGLAEATLRPEFTMLGRSYAFGREDDVEYWLTRRPIEVATFPDRPWAVWYPLRRTGAFYRLPREEQTEMLREHGIIGHNFGSAGYATDIRLECFGMDAQDSEFVLGLLSTRLDWLSKLVKEMRSTRQTGEFMDKLGPFFVGHTIYQSSPDA